MTALQFILLLFLGLAAVILTLVYRIASKQSQYRDIHANSQSEFDRAMDSELEELDELIDEADNPEEEALPTEMSNRKFILISNKLSKRSILVLETLGIVFVDELELLTIEKLKSVKGCGPATAKEIAEWAKSSYDIEIK